MIIPLRTDRSPRRRPIVTQALIAANVLVYLAGLVGPRFGAFDLMQLVEWGHFDPRDFKAWQLITALFLHDPTSIWHLAFNMLFLWVFGPPVEGRLKPLGFLAFYLMAGALANIAHMMVSPSPVIGASGAIAGVTGMFLALFPRSNIICFYLLTLSPIIISSLWLIGLYFVIDVLRQTTAMFGGSAAARLSNVAFMAHIAGYVYGFAMGFVLLGTKVIAREDTDVFFLFKQWKRRADMRAVTRQSRGGVWDTRIADAGEQLAARQRAATPDDHKQAHLADLRSQVQQQLAAHDLANATQTYRTLLKADPNATLSEQRQLEVANQLAAEGDHATAAIAYELLLRRHPQTASANEVRLLLGMLYARHLNNQQRARELITTASASLNDPGQKQLAQSLLAELTSS